MIGPHGYPASWDLDDDTERREQDAALWAAIEVGWPEVEAARERRAEVVALAALVFVIITERQQEADDAADELARALERADHARAALLEAEELGRCVARLDSQRAA